jgi:hypothetical protein
MENTIPTELLEIKARFDHWREHRKNKSEPIPDDLRDAALEMANRFPSSHVQRVLKIQLWHLKRRGPTRRSVRAASVKSAQPAFFKLPAEALFPPAIPSSPSDSSCRLQIERPDGSRLTITLPQFDSASIQRLCADFLRGASQ